MKRICEFYIRWAKLIGALYCILPTLAWFTAMLHLVPFRAIYLLRLVLVVVFGGPIAALVNEYGVHLWLIKHRSREGPATTLDGALIGAGVGMGITYLPPLTSLIATHHPEQAKFFILACWSAGIILGGLSGSLLAMIGSKYLDHESSR
jgi:hypothetical protein